MNQSEFLALPIGTVVKDKDGDHWTRIAEAPGFRWMEYAHWAGPEGSGPWDYLPLTIISQPAPSLVLPAEAVEVLERRVRALRSQEEGIVERIKWLQDEVVKEQEELAKVQKEAGAIQSVLSKSDPKVGDVVPNQAAFEALPDGTVVWSPTRDRRWKLVDGWIKFQFTDGGAWISGQSPFGDWIAENGTITIKALP